MGPRVFLQSPCSIPKHNDIVSRSCAWRHVRLQSEAAISSAFRDAQGTYKQDHGALQSHSQISRAAHSEQPEAYAGCLRLPQLTMSSLVGECVAALLGIEGYCFRWNRSACCFEVAVSLPEVTFAEQVGALGNIETRMIEFCRPSLRNCLPSRAVCLLCQTSWASTTRRLRTVCHARLALCCPNVWQDTFKPSVTRLFVYLTSIVSECLVLKRCCCRIPTCHSPLCSTPSAR